MLTKEVILKRLKDHKAELEKKSPVKNIGLFGSYARDEQTPESDIDLLVEFNAPIGLEIIDLVEALENIFSGYKIDLISKVGIKPHYLPYIAEDAIYA